MVARPVHQSLRKVFVLGAGASKPAGLPLIKDLLPKALWESCSPSYFPDVKNLDDCDVILQWLEGRTGLALRAMQQGGSDTPLLEFCCEHDAEEVLGWIDQVQDKNLTEAFTRLLFRALQPSDLSGDNCYPSFIKQQVMPVTNDKASIISFNYDTLLERALLEGGLGSAFSYCVHFVRVENWNRYRASYDGRLRIFKLHGSFNWSKCQTCNTMALCWYQSFDNIGKTICANCNQRYWPILIAPRTGKSITGSPWDNLWQKAREALIECQELTIIGYSFREADEQALSLFKETLSCNSQLHSVTIVDPLADGVMEKLTTLVGALPEGLKYHEVANFKSYVGIT